MFQIGQSLRDARLARELDLTDVAHATMIRPKFLAALEEERFDLIPGDAYVRSFLREYVRFLGLDSKPFLDQLDARAEREEPLPFTPPPRVHRRRRRTVHPVVLAVVGAAGVTVALLAWQLGGTPKTQLPLVPTQTIPVVTHPKPTRPARRRSHARPPAAAPTGPHVLVSAATGPVWLQVRRGSAFGPVVYENTLQPGGSVRFGRRLLWIRIGAPSSVSLRVDGKAAQLPPAAGSGPVNVLVTLTGQVQPG